MRKTICSMVLFASIMILFTGCTTWNGISQTDKPGTYYVVTNTSRFMGGIRPGAMLCTADEQTGNLKCKWVEVEEEWEEE